MKKAELNEERRRRAARMKRDQQAAAQRAIREGKGAKAKREYKLQEARESRIAKRKIGGELEQGMIRISLKRNKNQVIWSEEFSLLFKDSIYKK